MDREKIKILIKEQRAYFFHRRHKGGSVPNPGSAKASRLDLKESGGD